MNYGGWRDEFRAPENRPPLLAFVLVSLVCSLVVALGFRVDSASAVLSPLPRWLYAAGADLLAEDQEQFVAVESGQGLRPATALSGAAPSTAPMLFAQPPVPALDSRGPRSGPNGTKDPGTPDVPDLPSNPGAPDVPDLPSNPGTPEAPDVPSNPETPDTPDVPSNPDVPGNGPSDPGKPSNPGNGPSDPGNGPSDPGKGNGNGNGPSDTGKPSDPGNAGPGTG